ncbi:hypothetical protein ILUMI_05234, partial [Ignelater luminosus]
MASKGKEVSLKNVFDKKKYLLTNDKNIMNRWRDYFMDLLGEDAQLVEENQELTTDPVTKEELEAALEKTRNPRIDLFVAPLSPVTKYTPWKRELKVPEAEAVLLPKGITPGEWVLMFLLLGGTSYSMGTLGQSFNIVPV